MRLFCLLRLRPVATIPHLATRTGGTYPTAAKTVDALAGLGILRELTGRHRDRVFAYDGYLRILSEGTEPL